MKKIITITLTIALIIICTGCSWGGSMLGTSTIMDEIDKIEERNAELENRKERLGQLLAEEEHRRSDLEDEETYIKIRKYIEEKAKSIGFIYPDEIIFRKDD